MYEIIFDPLNMFNNSRTVQPPNMLMPNAYTKGTQI